MTGYWASKSERWTGNSRRPISCKFAAILWGREQCHQPEDLKVERVQFAEELDFDAAHSMPTPESWFKYPVVVQFMYSPDKAKVFSRVTISLLHYNGVSGFHTIFNVTDCLEHKDGDAPPAMLVQTILQNDQPGICL